MKIKNIPTTVALSGASTFLMMGILLLSAALWLSPNASASTLFGDVIRASDSAPSNAYGYSVSVSGNTAAIGSWFDDGGVYILQLDEETGDWQQIQKIERPEIAVEYGNFGFSVWLNKDQLVVGAPNILLSRPGAVSGYAFIYEKDAASNTWTLVASVEGDRAVPDEFSAGSLGREVVVQQGRAAVAKDDKDNFSSVLMYDKDDVTGDWTQTHELLLDGIDNADSDVEAADYNVTGIALDNNRLVVGLQYSIGAQVREFTLLLFEYNDTSASWVRSAPIPAFDAVPPFGGFFGLALDNNRLLVTDDVGAYLFEYNPDSAKWAQDPNFSNDLTINISGERLAADLEDSRVVIADSDGMGATVYERNPVSGRWDEIAQLSTTLVGTDAAMVTSVDLDGDYVFIGTPYIEEFTGAVVAYNLDDVTADDPDSDGITAENDNCPDDFNPTQANFDQDLLGDVCDIDDDNDGVDDINDAFPTDPTRQDPPIDLVDAPATPNTAMPMGNGIALKTDFRWPAVANASFYVIEVQHEGLIRAYEPNITKRACSDNQCVYIKSDAALEGANRWRLRAGNDTGISEWSPWTDFFVDQPAVPLGESDNNNDAFSQLPAIPVPQQPIGDLTKVADYFWSAVPGAIEYAIEVQHQGLIRAYEPSLPNGVACAFGQCIYTKSDAAKIGENRWRIRAINRVGTSNWSAWVNFTVSATATDNTAN